MPSKYVVHTNPAPDRFKSITKSGIIAWEEGCLKCAVCVKKLCVYNVYQERDLDSRQMTDSIDNKCMNCFRCVQGCPNELIHKSLNPEYVALGDSHWTPDIITKIWYQARSGSIPVSGAGYPGPFCGPGFDSMWTDMSEIVRPTRDGIHGREYISTAVDLGRTPRSLSFDENGKLIKNFQDPINVPLPMLLRVPSMGSISPETIKGWAMAAKKLNTFLAIHENLITDDLIGLMEYLIPVARKEHEEKDLSKYKFRVEEGPVSQKNHKGSVIAVNPIPITRDAIARAVSLAERGQGIIHLEGTPSGRALDDDSIYLKDAIRSVHLELVEKGLRDEVTILASGGLAMAEHVAKAIICGVDCVFVDFPLLIALECRMCGRCVKGMSCPVEIENASSQYVASRVVNLIGAWHNQLLEVMGAMGIRDARRLRGETGRAMFFEEMDEAIFGSMGNIEEDCELE